MPSVEKHPAGPLPSSGETRGTGGASTRVVIVDDHDLVREGLAAVIGVAADLAVTASVGRGRDALAAVEAVPCDVVLLDLRMPGMHGLEVLEELSMRHPTKRVLVLSGQTGADAIFQAFQRGAAGYLVKTARAADLTAAIRQVRNGRLRPSGEVAARLADHAFYSALSRREIEVVELAARGGSNKAIASQLGLTENTVKNHLRSIMEKLGTSDRTESVNVAMRRGIIDLEFDGPTRRTQRAG
jgi:DNA-binding NarL/FixJ family response regulator